MSKQKQVTRKYLWLKGQRIRLLAKYGSKCWSCGTTDFLEFAHLRPTGLMGKGRGSYERYLDVKLNPTSYTVLCRYCHMEFDKIEIKE